MKVTLIVLSSAAILATIIWFVSDPSWEPVVGFIGGLATLIALLYDKVPEKSSQIVMKQKGGKKSKNYQAGGDINITFKSDDE